MKKMNLIKQVLVALDLSEIDDQLLRYSKLFSNILDLERIRFVHVIPNYFSQEGSEIFLAGEGPISVAIHEKVKTLIQKKVNQQFSNHGKEIELVVDILEGTPYNQIEELTNNQQIDLLITGRKKKSEGSGITARRVAQRASCHVLFVPENANQSPSKILVPIDFSENAAQALKAALSFKKIIPGLEVTAVNIIEMLPLDYHLDFNQDPILKETFLVRSQKAYASFIEQHEISEQELNIFFLENQNYNVARQLHDYAIDKDFDLVLMGAKGHSISEKFLYGSVTERLVDFSNDIPVFIVR